MTDEGNQSEPTSGLAPQKTYPVGLALGSGGARGWAHIGVIRALLRAGIDPQVICGTSVGALVGAVHLGGNLAHLEACAENLTKLKLLRYLDLRMSGGGFIAGRKLMDQLGDAVRDVNIEELDRPYAAIATDLATGHEVWLRKGPLTDAMRASFALPGIFQPVTGDAQLLVDGALVNPIPVSACRAMGARLVIAVNLNSDHLGRRPRLPNTVDPEHDDGNGEAALPRRSGRVSSLLNQVIGHKDTDLSLFNVMISSLNIIQDRLTRIRLAGDPPDVVITPHVGHIGMLEFDRAHEVIAEGEAAAEFAMPALMEAMDILGIERPGT